MSNPAHSRGIDSVSDPRRNSEDDLSASTDNNRGATNASQDYDAGKLKSPLQAHMRHFSSPFVSPSQNKKPESTQTSRNSAASNQIVSESSSVGPDKTGDTSPNGLNKLNNAVSSENGNDLHSPIPQISSLKSLPLAERLRLRQQRRQDLLDLYLLAQPVLDSFEVRERYLKRAAGRAARVKPTDPIASLIQQQIQQQLEDQKNSDPTMASAASCTSSPSTPRRQIFQPRPLHPRSQTAIEWNQTQSAAGSRLVSPTCTPMQLIPEISNCENAIMINNALKSGRAHDDSATRSSIEKVSSSFESSVSLPPPPPSVPPPPSESNETTISTPPPPPSVPPASSHQGDSAHHYVDASPFNIGMPLRTRTDQGEDSIGRQGADNLIGSSRTPGPDMRSNTIMSPQSDCMITMQFDSRSPESVPTQGQLQPSDSIIDNDRFDIGIRYSSDYIVPHQLTQADVIRVLDQREKFIEIVALDERMKRAKLDNCTQHRQLLSKAMLALHFRLRRRLRRLRFAEALLRSQHDAAINHANLLENYIQTYTQRLEQEDQDRTVFASGREYHWSIPHHFYLAAHEHFAGRFPRKNLTEIAGMFRDHTKLVAVANVHSVSTHRVHQLLDEARLRFQQSRESASHFLVNLNFHRELEASVRLACLRLHTTHAELLTEANREFIKMRSKQRSHLFTLLTQKGERNITAGSPVRAMGLGRSLSGSANSQHSIDSTQAFSGANSLSPLQRRRSEPVNYDQDKDSLQQRKLKLLYSWLASEKDVEVELQCVDKGQNETNQDYGGNHAHLIRSSTSHSLDTPVLDSELEFHAECFGIELDEFSLMKIQTRSPLSKPLYGVAEEDLCDHSSNHDKSVSLSDDIYDTQDSFGETKSEGTLSRKPLNKVSTFNEGDRSEDTGASISDEDSDSVGDSDDDSDDYNIYDEDNDLDSDEHDDQSDQEARATDESDKNGNPEARGHSVSTKNLCVSEIFVSTSLGMPAKEKKSLWVKLLSKLPSSLSLYVKQCIAKQSKTKRIHSKDDIGKLEWSRDTDAKRNFLSNSHRSSVQYWQVPESFEPYRVWPGTGTSSLTLEASALVVSAAGFEIQVLAAQQALATGPHGLAQFLNILESRLYERYIGRKIRLGSNTLTIESSPNLSFPLARSSSFTIDMNEPRGDLPIEIRYGVLKNQNEIGRAKGLDSSISNHSSRDIRLAKPLKPNDLSPKGLPSTFVKALAVASDGYLWSVGSKAVFERPCLLIAAYLSMIIASHNPLVVPVSKNCSGSPIDIDVVLSRYIDSIDLSELARQELESSEDKSEIPIKRNLFGGDDNSDKSGSALVTEILQPKSDDSVEKDRDDFPSTLLGSIPLADSPKLGRENTQRVGSPNQQDTCNLISLVDAHNDQLSLNLQQSLPTAPISAVSAGVAAIISRFAFEPLPSVTNISENGDCRSELYSEEEHTKWDRIALFSLPRIKSGHIPQVLAMASPHLVANQVQPSIGSFPTPEPHPGSPKQSFTVARGLALLASTAALVNPYFSSFASKHMKTSTHDDESTEMRSFEDTLLTEFVSHLIALEGKLDELETEQTARDPSCSNIFAKEVKLEFFKRFIPTRSSELPFLFNDILVLGTNYHSFLHQLEAVNSADVPQSTGASGRFSTPQLQRRTSSYLKNGLTPFPQHSTSSFGTNSSVSVYGTPVRHAVTSRGATNSSHFTSQLHLATNSVIRRYLYANPWFTRLPSYHQEQASTSYSEFGLSATLTQLPSFDDSSHASGTDGFSKVATKLANSQNQSQFPQYDDLAKRISVQSLQSAVQEGNVLGFNFHVVSSLIIAAIERHVMTQLQRSLILHFNRQKILQGHMDIVSVETLHAGKREDNIYPLITNFTKKCFLHYVHQKDELCMSNSASDMVDKMQLAASRSVALPSSAVVNLPASVTSIIYSKQEQNSDLGSIISQEASVQSSLEDGNASSPGAEQRLIVLPYRIEIGCDGLAPQSCNESHRLKVPASTDRANVKEVKEVGTSLPMEGKVPSWSPWCWSWTAVEDRPGMARTTLKEKIRASYEVESYVVRDDSIQAVENVEPLADKEEIGKADFKFESTLLTEDRNSVKAYESSNLIADVKHTQSSEDINTIDYLADQRDSTGKQEPAMVPHDAILDHVPSLSSRHVAPRSRSRLGILLGQPAFHSPPSSPPSRAGPSSTHTIENALQPDVIISANSDEAHSIDDEKNQSSERRSPPPSSNLGRTFSFTDDLGSTLVSTLEAYASEVALKGDQPDDVLDMSSSPKMSPVFAARGIAAEDVAFVESGSFLHDIETAVGSKNESFNMGSQSNHSLQLGTVSSDSNDNSSFPNDLTPTSKSSSKLFAAGGPRVGTSRGLNALNDSQLLLHVEAATSSLFAAAEAIGVDVKSASPMNASSPTNSPLMISSSPRLQESMLSGDTGLSLERSLTTISNDGSTGSFSASAASSSGSGTSLTLIHVLAEAHAQKQHNNASQKQQGSQKNTYGHQNSKHMQEQEQQLFDQLSTEISRQMQSESQVEHDDGFDDAIKAQLGNDEVLRLRSKPSYQETGQNLKQHKEISLLDVLKAYIPTVPPYVLSLLRPSLLGTSDLDSGNAIQHSNSFSANFLTKTPSGFGDVSGSDELLSDSRVNGSASSDISRLSASKHVPLGSAIVLPPNSIDHPRCADAVQSQLDANQNQQIGWLPSRNSFSNDPEVSIEDVWQKLLATAQNGYFSVEQSLGDDFIDECLGSLEDNLDNFQNATYKFSASCVLSAFFESGDLSAVGSEKNATLEKTACSSRENSPSSESSSECFTKVLSTVPKHALRNILPASQFENWRKRRLEIKEDNILAKSRLQDKLKEEHSFSRRRDIVLLRLISATTAHVLTHTRDHEADLAMIAIIEEALASCLRRWSEAWSELESVISHRELLLSTLERIDEMSKLFN